MVGFLVVFLLLCIAIVYYIGWSLRRWLSPAARKPFGIVYAIVTAVVIASFVLARITGTVMLHAIGAYGMTVFYLLLLLLPPAQLAVRLLRFSRSRRRRAETGAVAATLVFMIALLVYGSYNAYSPVVRTYEISLENPSASAAGTLNIVMAADMHFGPLSDKNHAERLVREINALNPDLVLFPGDIVDDNIRPYLNQGIDRILAGIDARYGVYASLGNHDRHNGPIEELIDALERSGMRVLYDETVTVDGRFTLIGRKDRIDPARGDLSALMEDVDRSLPVILLDHQPVELRKAERLGVDLMVSGHTHGGQVFPGNLLTGLLYENHHGHLQRGDFHSVVTSGFGFWGPPIRLGTRSELVQIKVTFQ